MLIDGVTVKHITTPENKDLSFYYLDNTLILETETDLVTFTKKVIVKQEFLSIEEKQILNRLLERLNLKPNKEILFNGHSWEI